MSRPAHQPGVTGEGIEVVGRGGAGRVRSFPSFTDALNQADCAPFKMRARFLGVVETVWVEDGEVKFAVDGITIAGNLKKMFSAIEAVGTDVDPRSHIRCGSILVGRMTVAGE